MDSEMLSIGDVELLIHEVRGLRVILDEDIAALYEVETKYDSRFSVVFDAIRQLMTPPAQPRRQVGFVSPDDPSA
jgi:hypothetical protein